MSLHTTLHRGLSLLVIFSLLLSFIPAPALAQEPGNEPGQDESQRDWSFLPLVGAGATAPPPAEPPVTQPEQVTPVAYGDDGQWPVQLAGATGAMRPSLHGPQRNDPAEGIPAHAYSPFDERNNREHPCPPGGCNVMPGQLLLKLAPGVPTVRAAGAGTLRTTDATLNTTLDELGLVTLTPVFPTATAPRAGEMVMDMDGNVMPKPDLTRWVLATAADPDADLAAAVTTLRAAPRITWVEPVYLRKPVGEAPSAESEPRPSGRAATAPAAALTFNDPLYAQQWHLGATNVPQAWEWLASQGLPPGGNRDIVVAVIDTGVDYTHPDLAANIWTNSGETAGDGMDNDHNGYTDDVHGADTVAGDGDPQDDHGHGTHVAGIIAAQANNGIGGVGVAYNVQIMPLKAAQYSGVLASSDIAEAIYYATEKGADVINMSFGGYARSQVEEDALAVAFGQAVLVAAAGNDGKSNDPECFLGAPMYPAAYNWVLGVMASTLDGSSAPFSNRDCIPHDIREYEMMAPGTAIWSTLPMDQYAAWSGTSMAAPVVSGIAGLLRTYWADKDTYSSRFIMGQMAANTVNKMGGLADAYAGLTKAPSPELSYLQHWLFDTPDLSGINDNDGIVDAGETVELAIEIRNHWGKAESVAVTIEAQAEGAFQPDPYVTMITSTVNYGAIGSFSWKNNGLKVEDATITGVKYPFRFIISPDTPNDHVIPLRLTLTADNGYDPNDPMAPYISESRFYLVVQRGRELPSVISHDMILTRDDFWLIPRASLIEDGVTVTVTEGAQLQFWSAGQYDELGNVRRSYLQVEGTLLIQGNEDLPVEMFPGLMSQAAPVDIRKTADGHIVVQHARVMNPYLSRNHQPLDLVDHCYFGQLVSGFLADPDHPTWYTHPTVNATEIRHSIFRRIGYYEGIWAISLPLFYSTLLNANLYDSSVVGYPGTARIEGSVFLKNYAERGWVSNLSSIGYSCVGCDPTVGQLNNPIRNNAFLNVLWDRVNWMPIVAPAGRDSTTYINSNYWGTASTNSIDALLTDYYDDFNLSRFSYQPFLTIPSETTYPFVVDAVLSTAAESNTLLVGSEPVTFTVTFNRDMDTSIQPLVSFGPDEPYTDFAVKGAWTDARTWQGTFNITPVTGDGYQLIRVASARAADDPWLVTGDDSERFRFEIITSGTESMNLQANGGEGFVDLSWTQDDFDLLSGFNLYRATSQDGSYTRVNPSIIPPQERSFRDTDVAPGQPYFYKFTIVKSDMTESDFSNVATATPVDTIAPVISHTPVLQAAPGQALTFAADVTDNVGVQSVTLFHRKSGTTTYSSRAMVKTTGNRYNATLEGSLLASPGLDYYIEAGDGVSTARAGRADLPFVVTVVDRPVVTTVAPNQGPAGGGTTVTVRGSNFKAGATVAFGGIVATGVTVLSSSEITCITGAHFPEVVDVRVTNPDSQFGQRLRGYTYVADTASVGLPNVSAGQQELIAIPINAADVAGLAAAELTLTFDPAVLRATGARIGSLTPGWSLTANTSTPGQVRLALVSPGATAAGAGVLANIDFEVLAAAGVTTTLHLANVLLNDGAIPVQVADGSFTVAQVYAVSGTILTWKNSAPVPNANLTLTGDCVYTAASAATGVYTVTGVHRDGYTLTPEKTDDVNGISAYDAALALMHTVGTSTLTDHAFTAGDVNHNGSVSAMDAFYILQKSVDLITLPFPGAGMVWKFAPASRTYGDLDRDQTNQDFTAVLLGDISGNWGAPVAVRTASATSDSPTVSLGTAAPITDTTVLPLLLDTAGGQVFSLELVISYTDGGTPLAPELTTATADWMISSNLSEPGVMRIAMAGASPVTGSGAVLQLPFAPGAGADNLVVAITAARADEQEIGILPAQNQPALYLPLVHGR